MEAFAHLPDAARLWIFGVSRPLDDGEEGELLSAVDGFLEGWKAHGHPLAAAREWGDGRFLLVAVDERVTPPSGCSIDALVRALQGLEERFEARIVGGGQSGTGILPAGRRSGLSVPRFALRLPVGRSPRRRRSSTSHLPGWVN